MRLFYLIACLFGVHHWWAVPGGGEWICSECGKATFQRRGD
jgi:hypothetical protein